MQQYRLLSPTLLLLLPLATVHAAFPSCTEAPLANTTVCDTSKDPLTRASALVSLFTFSELVNNTQDVSPGVPRLGIPKITWWNEALHGVAGSPGVSFAPSGNFSSATSFPAPITMAAAFDDNMINQVGSVISTEARAFSNADHAGITFWAPNVNPFRDPRWGRGQETPGEDPFHVANYVYNFVTGMQNGSDPRYKKVVPHCKHYAAYDIENWEGNQRYGFNAIVTEQDLSEYYLPPFRSCARDADVGGIMCSYNAVNGIPSCADSYLLQTVLRDHWNWGSEEKGHLVVSDCDAVGNIYDSHRYTSSYSAAAADALNAGTDLDCGTTYPNYLPTAYNENLFANSTLVRAVTRLFTSLVTTGWFDPPASQPYRQLGWGDVNTPSSQSLAYKAAVEGTVLIKNNGVLPLSTSKVKNVALIGPWAKATTQMQSNYAGAAPYLHSPLYAAEQLGLNVTYVLGTNITSSDDSDFPAALAAAAHADVVIYAGGIDNTIEAEALDRTSISWTGNQLQLIAELAALRKPTVVLQFGGGQIDDSALLSNSNVSALVWGGYPGQDGGTAIFDVLFGKAAPAGRLPVTQYPANYVNEIAMTNMSLRASPGRTYRWYTGDAVVPFGFGLHYTNFSTSFVSANKTSYSISSLISKCTTAYLDQCPLADIQVNVSNTGPVTSDYVALLFLYGATGPTPYPIKTLVAYNRVHSLAAKGSQTISLPLTLGSIARVDANGSTVLYPGTYKLGVDIAPESFLEFTLTGAETAIEQWPQD